jgi:hypothetical protein
MGNDLKDDLSSVIEDMLEGICRSGPAGDQIPGAT